ncbi:hypothetical protein D3C71_1868600 [compost metagenome]
MVTASRHDPVTCIGIVFAQQLGGDGQVSPRIKGIARAGVAVRVVTKIGLSQPDIDAFGILMGEFQLECGTGRIATGKAARCASDIQGPGPGHEVTA